MLIYELNESSESGPIAVLGLALMLATTLIVILSNRLTKQRSAATFKLR